MEDHGATAPPQQTLCHQGKVQHGQAGAVQ